MKKIIKLLISMPSMGLLLIVYATAMAIATFIENDYGAPVARHIIYDSRWFELIQLSLVIIMIGNVFVYKLFRKKKLSILVFHLAFIIILIGAATTRYFGYEGVMHIREGKMTNQFVSDKSYLQIWEPENEDKLILDQDVFVSPYIKNKFSKNININGKSVSIVLEKVIPNAEQTIIKADDGHPVIDLVFAGRDGLKSHFLEDKGSIKLKGVEFYLNSDIGDSTVNFFIEKEKLYVYSSYETHTLSMQGETDTVFQPNIKHEIQARQLYAINNAKFVVKSFSERAIINYVIGDIRNGIISNTLIFSISSGDDKKEVSLVHFNREIGQAAFVDLNGAKLKLSYGVKEMKLPFALKLRDFQLDRYPGSQSPSSFASEVTLIDNSKNINEDYRIFMNNVLAYKGYRFYQSSYDEDEKGTVLSVNHDKAGTVITYCGYFLLVLGMIWSLIQKNSFFAELSRRMSAIRIKRNNIIALITFMFLFGAQEVYSQDIRKMHYDKEHSKVFGELLIQDHTGRIKPINTLSNELLRKISRKEKWDDFNSNQVFLGMIFNPDYWKGVRMIKVGHADLIKKLGVEDNYVSFNDLVSPDKGVYKLKQDAEKAFAKQVAQRDKYDKEVIAVDERLNISYQIYSLQYLKVFPVPGDISKSWVTPIDYRNIKDSINQEFVRTAFSKYFAEISKAWLDNNWSEATTSLESIKVFQKQHAAEILPSDIKVKMEVHYINFNIYKRIFKYYGLVGFVFLIILFIGILNPKLKLSTATIVFAILLGILFLLHTYGLGLRWYISGHAPFSNSYESMIYIAWATMLAGFIFMKKSPITLAVTAILASITLMVANLSWMNPEITNLVPVLKSLWLTIHVSVITASYGFLALGALIGLLSLITMIFASKKNVDRLDLTISELTNVNHMALIIGLYLLTIGTFLGAVWANESWGRYWGWDPKETWALISIIVYSFIVHTRFIPLFNNKFSFNFLSLIGFSSILMTYFGVNYYLSGLHSYAQGDPVPIPDFTYYLVVFIFVISLMAFVNSKKIILSSERKDLK